MVLEPWPASDPPTTEGQLAKADIDAKVVHLSPYWFRQSVDWDTRAMNLIHEGSHLFHTRDSWYKDPQTGKLSAIRVKDINDKNKSSVISGYWITHYQTIKCLSSAAMVMNADCHAVWAYYLMHRTGPPNQGVAVKLDDYVVV
ncbi:hypothetical protein BJ165DRAFT_1534367 [Panaeolus papilionaceus]|nr:hypothetical protein BJ165DRAFT_1534367 [Panaeolus papilionaceus]